MEFVQFVLQIICLLIVFLYVFIDFLNNKHPLNLPDLKWQMYIYCK